MRKVRLSSWKVRAWVLLLHLFWRSLMHMELLSILFHWIAFSGTGNWVLTSIMLWKWALCNMYVVCRIVSFSLLLINGLNCSSNIHSPDDIKDDLCAPSDDSWGFWGLWRRQIWVEIWVRYPSSLCLALSAS